jgi:hypothetical protein
MVRPLTLDPGNPASRYVKLAGNVPKKKKPRGQDVNNSLLDTRPLATVGSTALAESSRNSSTRPHR